ncbi:Ig-like domain-containing protein, partial [Myxococcus sp. AB025B]|uniref:Ig-like domain-containing protein n=1 Tax=Myxococcus sp. AB025B TaxID=2562794 RepID=UPI001891BA72
MDGTVPPDGVVIADVALQDPFGRTVHTSVVEFTNANSFDPLVSIQAQPGSLLINQVGRREQLNVFGNFAIAGEVNLSGGRHGVLYSSSNPTVVAVTQSGEVIALGQGDANIKVSYADHVTEVPVFVTDSSRIVATRIAPNTVTLERVGATLQLKLEGLLDDPVSGRVVDLSPATLNTVWSSSDPATVSISADGKLTSRGVGSAAITATHTTAENIVWREEIRVEALNGAPQVLLSGPASTTAGSSFEVRATASDDVAVKHVVFFVNGVPTAEDDSAPYTLSIQAPPVAGSTLRLAAIAVDSRGKSSTQATLDTKVLPPFGPSAMKVVYEHPAAGASLIEGLPHTLRVTSGDWASGSLSPLDFQAVRFTVDGAPVGVAQVPRVELRPIPNSKPQQLATVPIWEVNYIPPPGSQGSSAVIQAVAVDRHGATAPGAALMVRIVGNAPPLITRRSPLGDSVEVTEGVPLSVEGRVSDDALSFGVKVALLVNGNAVGVTRLDQGGQGGVTLGGQDFKLSWTPPPGSTGRRYRVELQAVDHAGLERRVGFEAVVKADGPPSVSVLTPVANASFMGGTPIVLTAAATDDSGEPPQVTWKVNGQAVGQSSVPPYRVFYVAPAVPQGSSSSLNLEITAVARDAQGHVRESSAIPVLITRDSSPPSVSILTPSHHAQVPNSQGLLVTVAGVDNVDVVKVEIYLDDEQTAFFTDNAPGKNAGVAGSFVSHVVIPAEKFFQGALAKEQLTLTARVVDAANNHSEARHTVFLKADSAPSLEFVSPAPGAAVTAATRIPIVLHAKDDVAVSRVDLYELRGGTRHAVSSSNLSPYRFDLLLPLAPGPFTLLAEAFDSAGQKNAGEVSLTLKVTADDEPPMVAFRSPSEGSTVFAGAGRSVDVVVVATDNVHVKHASLYLRDPAASNGSSASEVLVGSGPITGTTEGGLYQVFKWKLDVPAAYEGKALSLRAVVADDGNRTAERTLSLRATKNAAPVVSLMSPSPRTPVKEGQDVTVTFTVADDEGVASVAARSGGTTLEPFIGPIDVSVQQRLVVRAPIVDSSTPAAARSVGVAVKDVSPVPQVGHADVVLDIVDDVEHPTALLMAPIPTASEQVIQVPSNGSLGMRIEVSDDVRVSRVALFLDCPEGVPGSPAPSCPEFIPQDPTQSFLRATQEDFEEVRAPNPQGPGDILVSRRYVGTFSGTISFQPPEDVRFKPVPVRHVLFARAYDPAGNFTDTSKVVFEIVPVEDKLPPVVRVALDGVPDARTCVAGATVKLGVQASDDTTVQSVSVRFDGGEPLGGLVQEPSTLPADRVSLSGDFVLPTLTTTESRTVSFEATAVDTHNRRSVASYSCLLVPDTKPIVRWVAPTSGELIEEQRYSGSLELQDDVGLQAAWLVASTSEVTSVSSNSLTLAAPSLATEGSSFDASAFAFSKASLTFGVHPLPSETVAFVVEGEAGALRLTPHAPVGNEGAPGVLKLKVSGATQGSQARVTYHLRLKDNLSPDDRAALEIFKARFPSGDFSQPRWVALSAQPDTAVDIGFDARVVEVEQVQVELLRALGDARPVLVSSLAVRYQAGQPYQVRTIAAGQQIAVDPLPLDLKAGVLTSRQVGFRVPETWTSSSVSLTAVAVDTRGGTSRTTRGLSVVPDTVAPQASILGMAEGASVVVGQPHSVRVRVSDNASLARVRLLVDGIPQGEQLLVGTAQELVFPVTREALGPAELYVQVWDRAGNESVSLPSYLQAVPDGKPMVQLDRLEALGETLHRTELESGFVRLLQGGNATLYFTVKDDVGVKSVTTAFGSEAARTHSFVPSVKAEQRSVVLTPPLGAEGQPSVLTVTVRDTADHEQSIRLVVESRRPRAPELAFLEPAADASLVEGSIQLRLGALSADDTRVTGVEFFINDKPALQLQESDGIAVPTFFNEEGDPVASDVTVREALARLNVVPEEISRFRIFRGMLSLPAGFVRLDPNRSESFIQLRVEARDLEGSRATVERRIRVVSDSRLPVASILRPNLGRDVVEGTPVLVQVQAHDNAFVDRVEVYAGPSAESLELVHIAGGFPSENALPGSAFDVYSPVVTFQHSVPELARLGGLDNVPYFIATRARDVSGNYGEMEYQQIDVVRDREPALSILSPADGSRAVAKNPLPVVMSAEDDVAITSVSLFLDGATTPFATLYQAPFSFLVPVPETEGGTLRLQGRAKDSFGHEVVSQLVVLTVAEDQSPTVVIAQPGHESVVYEGRDLSVLVAAQDDVEVRGVEVTVEGGPSGPLHFVSTTRPYTFRVPLPHGSRDHRLTINAKARDSANQTTRAQPVSVNVQADTTPPTVRWASPAQGSAIREGLRLDVEARAEDNVGVASVTISAQVGSGAPVEVARFAAPPYRFSYSVPKALVPAGGDSVPVTFTAKAVDLSNLSATANVTVNVVDDEPPTVALVAPSKPVVVGQPAIFRADAKDWVALSHVTFLVGPAPDRLVEVGRLFIAPFDYTFMAEPSQVGQRLWMAARAVDSAGQATLSAPVDFTVRQDQPPTVALTRPEADSVVFAGARIRMEANAVDADSGIASVSFFVDGRKVATATTPAGIPGRPSAYVGSFVAPLGSGSRTFDVMAVAVDMAGQETASAIRKVGTIPDTTAPEVELIDPPHLDIVTEGEPLLLSAFAEDNAAVDRVLFTSTRDLPGGGAVTEELGSTAMPVLAGSGRTHYRYTWLLPTPMAGQQRTLQAHARDLAGNSAVSGVVRVEGGMRPTRPPYRPLGVSGESLRLSALAFDGSAVGVVGITGAPWGAPVTQGVEFFQVSDAAQEPVTGLAAHALDGVPVASAFHEKRALVSVRHSAAGRVGELVLFDTRDIGNIKREGIVDLSGPEVGGVAATGQLGFVANGRVGVVVVDLASPAYPQRIATLPVTGEALDVAVAGDRLLVAAGSGGLRVFDLSDPELGELDFIPVPGSAQTVSVEGTRAFVGCAGAAASLVVVDLRGTPRVLSLLSHASARADLLAKGQRSVAALGNLSVSTVQYVNAEGRSVKGLLTTSMVDSEGIASKLVHANIPEAQDVLLTPSGPMTLFGHAGVAEFTVPRLLVTDVTPEDGAEQVALSGSSLNLSVGFSQPLDAQTVTSARVALRKGLLNSAPLEVTVRLSASDDRRIEIILPSGAVLDPDTLYSITVEPGIRSPSPFSQELEKRFMARFRTGTTAGDAPRVSGVVPRAGPVDGGTLVKISGAHFEKGARVYFSGVEATDIIVDSDGGFIMARSPRQVEGPARVTVVNPGGLQGSLLGGFVYMDILQVHQASPSAGPLAGGQEVELTGAGFQLGAEVYFRGQSAQAPQGGKAPLVTVLSPGRMRVTTPPGSFGPADVVVVNPDGQRAEQQGAYLYSNLSAPTRVARYTPRVDGPEFRPLDRLPQGRPGQVVLVDRRAYLLSDASIEPGARDITEVLKRSVLGALSVVDVSVPGRASVMGGASFPPPYLPRALAVRQGVAYVAADSETVPAVDLAGEGGPSLLVVDVSQGSQPRLVSALPYEGQALEVALVDDLALVAAGEGGLAVFSLVDPLRPSLLGSVHSFLLKGSVRNVSIQGVRVMGRYGVLDASSAGMSASLVVDLARPGFPVVGEGPALGALALYEGMGLSAVNDQASVVSLVPPTQPRRIAPVPALVGTRFSRSDVGPHLGVSGGGSVVQLTAVSEPTAPLPIDAVDLWPATALGGVAMDRGLVVASLREVYTPANQVAPNDGLAIIEVPFPAVVSTQPRAHETGVPKTSSVVLDLNMPVAVPGRLDVRLFKLSGSVEGEPVTATVSIPEGRPARIVLTPANLLEAGFRYRVVATGLKGTADGSQMPGRFVMEFEASGETVSRQPVVQALSPREGPVAGGTLVTLTGSGFQEGLEVRFGGAPAVVESLSPVEVKVRTPASLTAGAVALEVRNPSGGTLIRAGAFLYTKPLELLAISPGRGPSTGGAKVVLTGQGFTTTGLMQVLFDGAPALRVRTLGMERIEAFTPNGLRGAVDVTVVHPSGARATLRDAYIFDQPTDSAVAFQGEIRDMVTIGDHVYMVGSQGLRVVDLSGVHRLGRLAGTPIPPERRNELVDEDGDRVDDRIVGTWSFGGGELLSLSYSPDGRDRLYVGAGVRGPEGTYVRALVVELDISRPFEPRQVSVTSSGSGAVFGLDARGDRLLAAAGVAGLRGFDITHGPFLLNLLPSPIGPTEAGGPDVSALAVEDGLAVVGSGRWMPGQRFTGGRLHTVRVDRALLAQDSLSLDVQRVRLRRDHWAVVAAGNEGLVLVDVSRPDDIQRGPSLGTDVLKGFASDVQLVGDLAYVAVGAAGVAVVDLSNVLSPRLLHHVAGASGGSAERVAVAGGRVVSARDLGTRGWSLEFGPAAELTVVSASVTAGEVVPRDLSSLLLSFSSTITPESARAAVSLTVDGEEWVRTGTPRVELEAGSPSEPASTVVLRFRPEMPLPAGAQVRLAVSTELLTPDARHLLSPFEVVFEAAWADGRRPLIGQVAPRVASTEGGVLVEILGENFAEVTTVLIGGAVAQVLPTVPHDPTRLRVNVPPGLPGLADVVVLNGELDALGRLVPGTGSGLLDRRAGAFLYKSPLYLAMATPRFLDPKGGSQMRVVGDGFLPAWAYGALGAPRVFVGGIESSEVSVVSTTELRVTAPPGSFDARERYARVRVLSSLPRNTGEGGTAVLDEEATLNQAVSHGLARGGVVDSLPPPPTPGEVFVQSFVPKSLTVDSGNPLMLYASAGASIAGNRLPTDYQGTYNKSGRYFDAFVAGGFDVQRAGDPKASLEVRASPEAARVDVLQAILTGYLPAETPWPELDLTPDSLDIATRDEQVLVANGSGGLAVARSTGTSLEVLGRAKFGTWAEPQFATRLLATPMGGWVAFNGMTPNPPPGAGLCLGHEPAAGTGGALRLVDTRHPSDPLLVGSIPLEEEPFGMALGGGRLFVVTGHHEGVHYCNNPEGGFPPPPDYSLGGGARGGQRTTYHHAGEAPRGALEIYASAHPGAARVKRLEYAATLSDVVVVGDTAIVAAAELGVLFFDISTPADARELTSLRIPFDERLSNTPGEPQRLRLLGDMLFVSSNRGGVLLVDVADPRHPELISGGNTEVAFDTAMVGDRLVLAGGDRLTELVVPFSFVTEVVPVRGSIISPDSPELLVRINRPIHAPSIHAGTVQLVDIEGQPAVGADGQPVVLTLTVENDLGTRRHGVRVRVEGTLRPQTQYVLRMTTGVTDQAGGSLLRSFAAGFQTGAANSRRPLLAGLEPHSLPRTSGGSVTLRGRDFTGTERVSFTVSGHAARVVDCSLGGSGCVVSSDGTALSLDAPGAEQTGPADVKVVHPGGPSSELASALFYLEPVAEAQATLSPDHGPVGGGTRVTLALDRDALMPGMSVLVGAEPAEDVDILDLRTVRFTTPRADEAGLATVRVVDPGQGAPGAAGSPVATFAYDMPFRMNLDLPGYPPKQVSELRRVSDTLFVGVSAPSQAVGLDIFDMGLEERPIRLGGVVTEQPVLGLDVSGSLAVLAEGAGISVVDVSEPKRPYRVGRSTTGGIATGVRIEGALAYVSVTHPGLASGQIQVFDLATPQPVFLRSVPLYPEDGLALELGVGRFYVLTSNIHDGRANGLRLAIHDREGVRVGGVVVEMGLPVDALMRARIAVRSGRAYISVGPRLYVFDVSVENEAHPVKLQSTALVAEGTGLTWYGGSLLVATRDEEETIVEVPATELLAVGHSPVQGAVAPADSNVHIDFNMHVDASSLVSGGLVVKAFSASHPPPSGRVVSGAVEVLFTGTRGSSLLFTPNTGSAFAPGERVEVSLAKGSIKSLLHESGVTRSLASPVSFSFQLDAGGRPQPVISSVVPASGPRTETTTVRIEGLGLGGAGLMVTVGGTPLTGAGDVVWSGGTPEALTVKVPPSAVAGPVAIQVGYPDGASSLRLGGFVYRDPLQLSAPLPDHAGQAGGVEVAFTGAGFMPGMAIHFGDTPSFDVRVQSSHRLTAVAPPHDAGLVEVKASLRTPTHAGGVRDHVAVSPRPFLYGAGAVARLETPPLRQVLVEQGVVYASIGGSVEVTGPQGAAISGGGTRTQAQGGVYIADPSEPTAVRQVARLMFPDSASSGAYQLVKAGSRLYVAAGTGGVKVVDVTRPSSPSLVHSLPGSGTTVGVAVGGEMLFAADSAGVRAYRTTEGAQPRLTHQRVIPGGVTALALHGHLLLVAAEGADGARLLVLDARRGDLAQMGVLPLLGPATHITAEGPRAFVSLGAKARVAIVDLSTPSAPRLVEGLVLEDVMNSGRVSAEQTRVAGGIAYVAAGGGKVQRFRVPVGGTPSKLSHAVVHGDASSLAMMDRYLLVGTLVLDKGGRAVELPILPPEDGSGGLAGAIASVTLDHLELRGTLPSEGETVPVGTSPVVLLSELPSAASLSEIHLETSAGQPVAGTLEAHSEAGGARVVLTPTASLQVGTSYVLKVGSGLADVRGGTLGAEVEVRFQTASQATLEAPTLVSVEPAYGLTAGGETLDLFGTGFRAGCTVYIGGLRAGATAAGSCSVGEG